MVQKRAQFANLLQTEGRDDRRVTVCVVTVTDVYSVTVRSY